MTSSRKQEEGEAVTGRNAIDEEFILYDFGKYEHLVDYLISSDQVSFGVPSLVDLGFFFLCFREQVGETTS